MGAIKPEYLNDHIMRCILLLVGWSHALRVPRMQTFAGSRRQLEQLRHYVGHARALRASFHMCPVAYSLTSCSSRQINPSGKACSN